MPWIRDLRIIPILEQQTFVDAFVRETLGELLREHGLERGRIGVDETSTLMHLSLQRQLPGIDLTDGDTAMQLARRIKLPDEIIVIEEATALADAVTASAIDAVAEGRREWDVVADALHTLFSLGAEYPHLTTPFVASGEHMSPPHRFSTEKLIRYGDIVFIDIGAGWNGYYGDVARTVICGRPSRRQQEIYMAVFESLQAGIAEMRAGNTERRATEGFHRGAARLGLEDRFFSLFIGHGIGMGSNEPPYIGETNPGRRRTSSSRGWCSLSSR
jgi:Xaa-Pro dipeptidase